MGVTGSAGQDVSVGEYRKHDVISGGCQRYFCICKQSVQNQYQITEKGGGKKHTATRRCGKALSISARNSVPVIVYIASHREAGKMHEMCFKNSLIFH